MDQEAAPHPSFRAWTGGTATAAQIILLVWITVIAVLLVDSESLLRRAQSSPDQTERILLSPLAQGAVALAVPSGLTRPRQWLDALSGGDQSVSGSAFEDGALPGEFDDALPGELAPLDAVPAAAGTPAPDAPAGSSAEVDAPGLPAEPREWTYRGRLTRLPRRAQPPPLLDAVPMRRPTPGRPLRVLVTGDSTSTYPGFALQAAFADDPRVRVATVWRNGTGLATPQRFDWSTFAPAEAQRRRADVVVISMGANDAWPLQRRGELYPMTTARWRAEYARRAAILAERLQRAGVAHVIWLSPPQVADPVHDEVFRDVTLAVTAAAQYQPGLVVLDLYSGRPVVRSERQADGIHFTRDASTDIAASVIQTLRDGYPMLRPQQR